MLKQNHPYRTENGTQIIELRYTSILKKWPGPFNEHYIQTTAGRTFVLEGGNPGREPLVLLHGSMENSTMWFKYWSELSRSHHIYAIDIIGEVGRSLLETKLKSSSLYPVWLKEVFDALEIPFALMAGVSSGASICLFMASQFPERVKRVIAMVPTGVICNISFIALCKILLLPIHYNKKRQASLFRYLNGKSFAKGEGQEHIDIAFENNINNNRVIMLPVFKFKPEKLSAFKVPCTCYMAELDPLSNAHAVKREINRLNGNIKVVVIPGQGHFLDFNLLPYLNLGEALT